MSSSRDSGWPCLLTFGRLFTSTYLVPWLSLCNLNTFPNLSLSMWWALGVGIWVVLLMIVVALCRSAGDADRHMTEAQRRMLDRTVAEPLRTVERRDRAA